MPLGRTAKQLNHTLKNLAASLIEHESVTTTMSKAKLTQGIVENLITKAKRAQLTQNEEKIKATKIRMGIDIYKQYEVVPKIFDTLVPRYADREGGYTRIVKLEPRIGDNAPQAVIELVDNGSRELQFWYMARIVAKLEMQKVPLDKLTRQNVKSLLLYRQNGEEEFKKAVETCKEKWYKDIKEEENYLPRIKSTTSGFNKSFHNYKIVPRPAKKAE